MLEFSNYEEWFKELWAMCNEDNYVDSLYHQFYSEYGNYFEDPIEIYKHYQLENGIHIYVDENTMYISDSSDSELSCNDYGDIDGIDFPNSANVLLNHPEFLHMHFGVPTKSNENPFAYIMYDKRKETYSSFLPSSLDDEGENINHSALNYNLEVLLKSALMQAEKSDADSEILNKYQDAIKFYNQISSMVLQKNRFLLSSEGTEISKEAQETSQNFDNQTNIPNEQLSIEELENMLNYIQSQNISKATELQQLQLSRKKELIEQIIAEQKKGQDLDAQLRDAKAKVQYGGE